MTINRFAKSLALVLGVLTLAACSSRPAPDPGDRAAALEGPVVGPRWNLLLVGTDERLSMPETPYFVVARDGRVSGSDGCNQLHGRVQLDQGNRIEFTELAGTRRACPQAEDARRVTAMMKNAYRYLIDHDRLVFFGPDQRVLGGFRRAD